MFHDRRNTVDRRRQRRRGPHRPDPTVRTEGVADRDQPSALRSLASTGSGGRSHQRSDSGQAVEAVAEATGAPTAANEIDAEPLPVKPDRLLANGDTVQIGELTFDVIHLRGHTPGSIALALGGPATGEVTQLFIGDCLFPGGVGKTWQPGDFAQLLDDVTTRVFDVYPDSTVIYPGHGDDTALGTERPHLAEWRERGW